jgi:DnaJ-class molecular chaperone
MPEVLGPCDIVLEDKCFACNGKGAKSESEFPCWRCEGRGIIITEFGAKVLDFVARNLKLNITGKVE